MWGGGGGPGGTSTYYGGGGAAYATKVSIPVTNGSGYNVTVGSGGSFATNGGPSSFGGSIVVADGGKANGSGGTVANSTGDTKYAGGNGAYAGGGGASASPSGAGGNASGGTGGASPGAGASNSNNANGGGGGNTNANGPVYGGGAGYNGQGTGGQGQVILIFTPAQTNATGTIGANTITPTPAVNASHGVSASVVALLPFPTALFSALHGESAAIAVQTIAPVAAFVANHGVSSSISATNPNPVAAFQGNSTVPVTGQVAANTLSPTVAIQAKEGAKGSIAANTLQPTVAIQAKEGANAAISTATITPTANIQAQHAVGATIGAYNPLPTAAVIANVPQSAQVVANTLSPNAYMTLANSTNSSVQIAWADRTFSTATVNYFDQTSGTSTSNNVSVNGYQNNPNYQMTITPPPGAYAAYVTIGGAPSGSNRHGGAGGGYAYAYYFRCDDSPKTVQVGLAPAHYNNGTSRGGYNGGDTWFIDANTLKVAGATGPTETYATSSDDAAYSAGTRARGGVASGSALTTGYTGGDGGLAYLTGSSSSWGYGGGGAGGWMNTAHSSGANGGAGADATSASGGNGGVGQSSTYTSPGVASPTTTQPTNPGTYRYGNSGAGGGWGNSGNNSKNAAMSGYGGANSGFYNVDAGTTSGSEIDIVWLVDVPKNIYASIGPTTNAPTSNIQSATGSTGSLAATLPMPTAGIQAAEGANAALASFLGLPTASVQSAHGIAGSMTVTALSPTTNIQGQIVLQASIGATTVTTANWLAEYVPMASLAIGLASPAVNIPAAHGIAGYSSVTTLQPNVFVQGYHSQRITTFSGGQGEIMVLNQTLTDDELFKVQGYLAWRWHRPDLLPIGHPYRNHPPIKGYTPPQYYQVKAVTNRPTVNIQAVRRDTILATTLPASVSMNGATGPQNNVVANTVSPSSNIRGATNPPVTIQAQTVPVASAQALFGPSMVVNAVGQGLVNIVGYTGPQSTVQAQTNSATPSVNSLFGYYAQVAGTMPAPTAYTQVGDKYWSSVQGLVNFNDGQMSSITDVGPHPKTFTGQNLTASSLSPYASYKMSSAQTSASTSYFKVAGDASLTMTGDFTIEFWMKSTGNTAGSAGQNNALVRQSSASGFNVYQNLQGSNGWRLTNPAFSGTGNTAGYCSAQYGDTSWHHIVFQRSGTTLTAWQDGALYTGVTNSSGTIDLSAALFLNSPANAGLSWTAASNESYFLGNITDLRITKGAARYSGSTYTLPITQYSALT